MNRLKHVTCIVCPLGCGIQVLMNDGAILNIAGNGCKRGEEYARAECTNPVRVLTTTIRVDGGTVPLVSVKSDKPLPKFVIQECIKHINNIIVKAPIGMNDIIVSNIMDTGVNIIATKIVGEEKGYVKKICDIPGSGDDKFKGGDFQQRCTDCVHQKQAF